jgi:hypothetical protein
MEARAGHSPLNLGGRSTSKGGAGQALATLREIPLLCSRFVLLRTRGTEVA